MKIKIYNYRFQNTAQKIFIGIMNFTVNLAFPIILCWAIFFIMALCGVLHYLTMELCYVFLGISAVIGMIFALSYAFGFKGVILYDSYIEITNRTLVGTKPKIKIDYSDIVCIYNSYQDIRLNRRKINKSSFVGDPTNYVEITLYGGKQFCFAVYNQKEFVDEVISRVNEYNEKNK